MLCTSYFLVKLFDTIFSFFPVDGLAFGKINESPSFYGLIDGTKVLESLFSGLVCLLFLKV
jgi:hypothetical protein